MPGYVHCLREDFVTWGAIASLWCAGALAIAFVFSSGFGMQKFKNVESGEVDKLSETQTNFARGRAAYLQDLHPESPTDVAIQAPLAAGLFLIRTVSHGC